MNDHDAMDAIIAVLDRYIYGHITAAVALNEIAHITGLNGNDHAAAKEARS